MNKIRKEIVKILHKNLKEYISGQKIGKKLGVSRTTVSNHIKKLRKKGYEIESKTNQGYRLLEIPDLLIPETILWGLDTDNIGQNIYFFKKVTSTNTRAKEIAAQGVESGSVVIAEAQTQGKGRRGRKWFSASGKGLWFSLILRPDFKPNQTPLLTIMAALSVKEAFEKLKIDSFIKWPNDIMINNKKVCGILSELSAEIDRVKYAVIGIGININQKKFPEEIKNNATSLSKELNKEIDRVKLLKNIFRAFEYYYEKLNTGRKEELLNLWENKLDILDKKIKVESNKEIFRGKAVGISSKGELLLKDKNGKIHSFWTGDTSLVNYNKEGGKI